MDNLADVASKSIVYGIVQAGPEVEGGIPYIKSTNVGGKINVDVLNKTSPEIAKKYARSEVLPGDIVVSLRGNIGETSIVPKSLPVANLTQGTARISVNGTHDTGFIQAQIAAGHVQQQLYAVSKGSALKEISLGDLRRIKVLTAPLKEQKTIATILSAWDRAIDKAEALIKAKEQRKTGLMQRLLTGKVRFGEFAGETWKEMSIGKLLRQVKRPVVWDDDASYKLLSLRRASGGLFHRQTLRGSEILTKKMNTALEGDFLISKMQVVHGATGLTTAEFDGYHVSDSYLAYVARDPSTLDIRFFNWLCKTKQMYHKAYRSSYGVHIEKMTFNPKLWLKETIMLPPTTDEQAKIVEVLDTSVAEIEEHRTQLAALKDQKKGLMRQLLTGKVRVKAKE